MINSPACWLVRTICEKTKQRDHLLVSIKTGDLITQTIKIHACMEKIKKL